VSLVGRGMATAVGVVWEGEGEGPDGRWGSRGVEDDRDVLEQARMTLDRLEHYGCV
jgi:hypothetical protein